MCPSIVELGAGFWWLLQPDGCVRSGVSLPSIRMLLESDVSPHWAKACQGRVAKPSGSREENGQYWGAEKRGDSLCLGQLFVTRMWLVCS